MFQLNEKIYLEVFEIKFELKIYCSQYLEERTLRKKNSLLFPGPFVVQMIASTVASILAKISYPSNVQIGFSH